MTPHLVKEFWKKIVGTTDDVAEINWRMTRANERGNVLSPAPTVGEMPPGLAVNFSLYTVRRRGLVDLYELEPDRFSLKKAPLLSIASALGFSWPSDAERRTDDGRHPHYCSVHVACTYRAFDGTLQALRGDKDIDLRDGTEEAERMRAKDPQDLHFARKHILANAYTAAQLRAIRSFGIRTDYSWREMGWPFVCVRVVLATDPRDPELKREMFLANQEALRGARPALYGHAEKEGSEST